MPAPEKKRKVEPHALFAAAAQVAAPVTAASVPGPSAAKAGLSLDELAALPSKALWKHMLHEPVDVQTDRVSRLVLSRSAESDKAVQPKPLENSGKECSLNAAITVCLLNARLL